MDEEQVGGSAADDLTATLTIEVGGTSHTVHRGDAAVTIGREPPSQILLSESGVSRTHLRIQYDEDHWSLTDTGSRNGTFVNGERVDHLCITATMTVHLGGPSGIALRLDPQPPHDVDSPAADTPSVITEKAAAPSQTIAANEPTARAGAAVKERREELGLSPDTLIAGVMTFDDYARFEGGYLWLDDTVRGVLEQRLMWPDGVIDRVREGAEVPDEELTDLLSPTVQTAVALDAAEVEVRAIRARIDRLPHTSDQRFLREVTPLLTQLRRLDHLSTAAARKSPGRLDVAAAVAGIRQARAELLLRASRSPWATLGQQLGAVRHRGRMSIAEVATAAGVTVADVETVEREERPSAHAVGALERFVVAVSERLRIVD